MDKNTEWKSDAAAKLRKLADEIDAGNVHAILVVALVAEQLTYYRGCTNMFTGSVVMQGTEVVLHDWRGQQLSMQPTDKPVAVAPGGAGATTRICTNSPTRVTIIHAGSGGSGGAGEGSVLAKVEGPPVRLDPRGSVRFRDDEDPRHG